jgi:hypothetical protein
MTALTEKFGDETGTINIPQDELIKALTTMKTSGPRGRKTRVMRDPDAPKRPTSSYMLWLNDNRKTIADENFPKNDDGEHCYPEGHDNAGDPLKGRSKVSEITKKAGALWKELTEEDKTPYVDRFAEAQATYREAMEDYTPSEEFKTKTKSKSKSSFDSTQRSEAPEGWNGPHENTYLPKIAKDPETGKNIKSIKDFDEAVAKANELGEGCGGLTLTSTGYSLRVGPDLRENPEKDRNSGLASWSKASNDVFNDDTDAEELAAPKKVSKKPSKKEIAEELTKVVDGAKKDSEAKKATKKSTKKKEPEPEPEPESDSEDESDDDEMEVEQITIDGDDYFLNETTGDIYHPETQEIVGKSEDGEHTIF